MAQEHQIQSVRGQPITIRASCVTNPGVILAEYFVRLAGKPMPVVETTDPDQLMFPVSMTAEGAEGLARLLLKKAAQLRELQSHPGLPMWTIYHRPSDVPGAEYVVRNVVTRPGGVEFIGEKKVARTLDEARGLIPQGLVCLPRDPQDDPVIVETWF